MLSLRYDVWPRIWPHLRSLKPSFISRHPHFNFITIHYCWIMGMAILTSIAMYADGGLRYIDALFFGSGCATQSGLNTVDVNLLTTWQQVAMWLAFTGTNPIVIHSFVVFLRLYWFEKRFQHIVREARRTRRSLAQSFSKSKTDEKRDVDGVERGNAGVQGRSIVVMHKDDGHTDEVLHEVVDNKEDAEKNGPDGSSDSSLGTAVDDKTEAPHAPTVQFASRVRRSNGMPDELLRIPSPRSHQDHIAFVESQRQSEQGETLHIPGPREYDAGVAPSAMKPGMKRNASRAGSTHSQDPTSPTTAIEDADEDDDGDEPDLDEGQKQLRKRTITIAEPERPQAHRHDEALDDMQAAAAAAFSPYRPVSHFLKRKNAKHDADHSSIIQQVRSRTGSMRNMVHSLSTERPETTYLSWEPTVGRNSAFVNLTEDQREELGGIEYRSLKSLALILVCYFWGFLAFACLCLTPWIIRSQKYSRVVEAVGQNRVWWGIFTANSAFNDVGFTLTPDSMISFQRAAWPLLSMTFLIIIGNTGFPIMLRFIIWVTSLWVPKDSGIFEELRFLLDHPRRCFTLLFPGSATWWLFGILIALNAIDLIFFIILDLNTDVVTSLPVHVRLLTGLFQAVSTRTAGLAVVNIAELHPAIQVSYMVMMYISALPIAISIRRTNVYEERSLGIWGTHDEPSEMGDGKETSYVGAHVRRQLSFDLWFIFLGFFIIAIAEGGRIADVKDTGFTMFSILFEVVSAYGTVGLSLGYPGINASFSAEFNVISKLVIIAMQIRGRHRGLPYELDRAILLPNEHRQAMEAEFDNAYGRQGGTLHHYPSKAKTLEKQHSNLIGGLLHPGPAMHHRGPPRSRRPSAVSYMSTQSAAPASMALHTGADVGSAHPRNHSAVSLPRHLEAPSSGAPMTMAGKDGIRAISTPGTRRNSVISEKSA